MTNTFRRRLWVVGWLMLLVALILAVRLSLPNGPAEPIYKGKPLMAWFRDLGSRSALDRTNATLAIQHIGTNALPFLIYELTVKDSGLVGRGRSFLLKQRWIHINFRDDYERHLDAINGLRILGPVAKPAIPALANFLTNHVGRPALYASHALTSIGTSSIPAFESAATGTNAYAHLISVEILGQWHDTNIVPTLVTMLQDPDNRVQQSAAFALGKMGPAAKVAKPKLKQMLASTDDNLVAAATGALIQFDFDDTLAFLTNRLTSTNVAERVAAAWALNRCGSRGKPAVPALVKCLADGDSLVRNYAAVTLGGIGADPDLAVPALMAQLSDPPPLGRVEMIIVALGKIGPRAQSAVPVVLKLLNENQGDEDFILNLQDALQRIDPAAADSWDKAHRRE